MALHFVSTSVLVSEDGVDFGKETHLESAEVRKSKELANKSVHKPLYLQLAENNVKKEEEYDLNTKKMFAPPKALDDEDIEFLNQLQSNRNNILNARNTQDEQALKVFRSTIKGKDKNLTLPTRIKIPSKVTVNNIVNNIRVLKRKSVDEPKVEIDIDATHLKTISNININNSSLTNMSSLFDYSSSNEDEN